MSETNTTTPGPWEAATGSHGKARVSGWQIRRHQFDEPPHEGDLEDEWGIYPPLGEIGPVALVAGEANARLLACAPEMLEALREAVHGLGLPDSMASEACDIRDRIQAVIADSTGATK